jgi:hypothetical protein
MRMKVLFGIVCAVLAGLYFVLLLAWEQVSSMKGFTMAYLGNCGDLPPVVLIKTQVG